MLTNSRIYEVLVNNSTDLITLHDISGIYLFVSSYSEALIGYKPEELVGLNPYSFIHPDDIENIKTSHDTIMTEGESYTIEYRHRCKNSQYIWVETVSKVHYSEEDDSIYIIATTRLIEIRKMLEQHLAESQRDLKQSQDVARLGHYVLDTASGIWSSSEALDRIFGINSNYERSLEGWLNIVRPDYREIMRQYFVEEILGQQSDFDRVYPIVNQSDGSICWVQGLGALRTDQEGRIQQMFGTIQDITERKIIEEERERLLSQLEQKAAEQERFIYTVSHDLKSPLITISGFCDLAKMGYVSGDQEQINNSLDMISNAADRMNQLLNDLLHISRIGIKKNQSEIVKLDVLIKDSIENVSGVIVEHKTAIEIEPELPDVLVDRQYLLQVIENLLSNASKYSHSATGGSKVKFGVIRNEEELICYVKDNGIGIETEYLEKIFGLFEKLDAKSDGTGVGLAIVKRIIETHGGRIWAESEGLGHGTTFFFTLPEA